MKVKSIIICFLLSFSLIAYSSDIISSLGNVKSSYINSLDEKIAILKNTPEKKTELDLLEKIQTEITNLNKLNEEIKAFNNIQKTIDSKLRNLEVEYSKIQTTLKENSKPIPNTEEEIQSLVNEYQKQQLSIVATLNKENSDLISQQAFTARAQSKIISNNNEITAIKEQLSQNNSNISEDEINYNLIKYSFLEKETELLQNKLILQPKLQDWITYKIKIASIHNNFLTERIRLLQEKKTSLNSEVAIQKDNKNYENCKELLDELNENSHMTSVLNTLLQDNNQLIEKKHEVEVALNNVKQIKKNVDEQIKDLNGSIILSRLLNRQLSEIPNIKLTINLDEYIPTTNIWIYDLKTFREEVFDVPSYVDKKIAEKPILNDYKQDLEQIIRHRKALFDDIYQALIESQSLAYSLKEMYSEYLNLKSQIEQNINNNLFWLASNHPLSVDFMTSFIPSLFIQVNGFIKNVIQPEFIYDVINFALKILLPLTIFLFIFKFINKWANSYNNKIARKLDKNSDNFFITPVAIILTFLEIIPKAIKIIIICSLIIFISLDNDSNRYTVLLITSLHILTFLYFLKVTEKNSLGQRHFSLNSWILKDRHILIKRIWWSSIPIVLITNIRAIETDKISNDVIGYCVFLISSIYVLYLLFKTIKEKIENQDFNYFEIIMFLISIVAWFILTGFMVLGYFYTTIILTSKIIFTLYLYFAYLLLSYLVKRELYVAEIKFWRKTIANNLSLSKNDVSLNNNKKNKLDLRLELINTKAFKLINILIIGLFAYLVYLWWFNLGYVFKHLDNIYLWTSSSIVDGKEIITHNISLGSICFALLTIVITIILNKNLPPLLERLFLLRFNLGQKGTSYTIKIISSYAITTIGLIVVASAIGLSWNNLQWLVAALSVGLGFGLQEIFGNFVSGLIILFERQIRVGDIVTLGSLSGTVNKIRIRATTIISFDNKEVMIPNKEFITTALTNWSLSNTITMIEFAVGVAYDADVEEAKRILTSIIKRCKNLAPEKSYRVYIKSLDASAVTIMCEVFVSEIGKRKDTFDYLSSETLRRFAKAKIEIPFNQLDVKIKNLDNGKELNIGKN